MLTLRILWTGLWVYLDSTAIRFTIDSSVNWYNEDLEIISHIAYYALIIFIIWGLVNIIQDCILWNKIMVKPYFEAMIGMTDKTLRTTSKIMRYARS